jgi:hypothetical protein
VGYLSAMGQFIDSACPRDSFNLWCALECYYHGDSSPVVLVPAQKIEATPGIMRIGYHVLIKLTACLYSDNVFTPN